MTTLELGQRVREARLFEVRNVPGTPDRKRPPDKCRGGQVLRLLGDEAYVRWDPDYSFEPDAGPTPLDHVAEWVRTDRLAPEVVHVLHHGLPLCGFSRDLPRDWPDGHVWTHLKGHDAVTCEGCSTPAREVDG